MHFVTKEDYKKYLKTACAEKYINIRSIINPSLIKPYEFKEFKDIENMYLTESVNLEELNTELIRAEKN